MRLWSIHPQYLDTRGLVAAWREALLAQKVLKGETKGYRNHPQLNRFKACADPVGAAASYLRQLHEEARERGYSFSEEKIAAVAFDGQLDCTRGQLLYEWRHLKEKLRSRDAAKYEAVKAVEEPAPHPLFKIVEGGVEAWEIIRAETPEI
ncbi:MAG TPA: pyrimidine dimer DNA glycosylase/endonuclease V [Pyrinomonadaceae bacterium]|nr:pyrimidine dimer DNA glycosylase/endonuclease V [Pyrinomonadaceae bacterium]